VEIVMTILEVIGLVASIAMVRAVVAAIRLRHAGRRGGAPHRVPAEPPRWPSPAWVASLLVRFDPDAGVFRPSVQVQGDGQRRDGRIELELRDDDDAVRADVHSGFPAEALNTELPLPPFAPPDGVSPAEALGWRWVITLGDGSGHPARWTQRPSPAGSLNAEAELGGIS
jgi:hypothetical protein